ncbi:MAG: pyridoxamine 5'-phosphate oxidase family protein [Bacteroidales bacterium]|nr:pyridoxamine 5'-phosphate oxidase family protein [Bacteroidales bacterium]
MRPMRKAARELSAAEALEIFDRAPFVTLSMIRPDGTPYGLPISVVRKDENTFYFHCAFEGEKIDCIRHNPIVSLSAVSRCKPVFETEKMNYTEHYRSAIALGECSPVEEREEKVEGLRLLCERFLPDFMEHFEAAIERSLERTAVYRITLTEPPLGKCKH